VIRTEIVFFKEKRKEKNYNSRGAKMLTNRKHRACVITVKTLATA
jgi:hypothetical protein